MDQVSLCNFNPVPATGIPRANLMYRSIVRQRVLGLFDRANRGDWKAVVDILSDRFSYRFAGESPLGGTRTTKPAMMAWFARLYRLFPGAQFRPQMVVVEGPPWNTRVMTHVRIESTAPDASGRAMPYANEFMQLMHLKWGRITSVVTLEDTQRFAAVLPALAAAGIGEATAAPITDESVRAGSAAGRAGPG
jgi:ketosteroid isomerase-like protein